MMPKPTLSKNVRKRISPDDVQALSLVQLAYVRKYNRRSVKAVKDEYIFELFFQLGIDKNDLIACNFPKTRNLQVDEIIKKIPKGEVKTGTIDSYFIRVTQYLKNQQVYNENRRNINSYDLTLSHRTYFLRCPNCGKSFENIAKYWVAARVNILEDANYQGEYSIVCAECKGA